MGEPKHIAHEVDTQLLQRDAAAALRPVLSQLDGWEQVRCVSRVACVCVVALCNRTIGSCIWLLAPSLPVAARC